MEPNFQPHLLPYLKYIISHTTTALKGIKQTQVKQYHIYIKCYGHIEPMGQKFHSLDLKELILYIFKYNMFRSTLHCQYQLLYLIICALA